MNLFKHMLVVTALLMAMLPCSHALGHHAHEPEPETTSCSLTAQPCECHSCDHGPCPGDAVVEYDLVPASEIVAPPATETVLFRLPEPRQALSPILSPVSATLAVLQTVQLLI